MESKFNFNTVGLFTTDNKSMVAFTATSWGQRTCYITDPKRNLIEIHSFTKE